MLSDGGNRAQADWDAAFRFKSGGVLFNRFDKRQRHGSMISREPSVKYGRAGGRDGAYCRGLDSVLVIPVCFGDLS